jgi:hypothetical protein
MSIHRYEGGSFYPGSTFGGADMVGEGPGEGMCANHHLWRFLPDRSTLYRSVNIPWPGKGFDDKDYIYAFQKIVMPIAYEFAPDFVIGTFCVWFLIFRSNSQFFFVHSVCGLRRGYRRSARGMQSVARRLRAHDIHAFVSSQRSPCLGVGGDLVLVRQKPGI